MLIVDVVNNVVCYATMDTAIESIRSFNRFFTQHVGAIDARFLGTEVNLPEARLLFEIARKEPVQANALQAELCLDRGYLSRMITRFENRGWVLRDRLQTDGRSRPIRLTDVGREVFDQIDQRQRAAVAHDIARLDAVAQDDLVQALTKARLLLDPDAPVEFVIRPARIGEVSQVAARQSILYAASHGWGRELETLEAETTAAFLRRFKPGLEQCWVADLAGTMAGAVFLTHEGDGVARLRLLHVEPFARRRGIGEALVAACVGFARDRQYDRIELWTQTVLDAARRIYARHGFECTSIEVHHQFGEPVQGETWQLLLAA